MTGGVKVVPEIDSLEISIQSTVGKVNLSLDNLISKLGKVSKGITAITKGNITSGFSRQAADAAKTTKLIYDSMGNVISEVKKKTENLNKNAANSKQNVHGLIEKLFPDDAASKVKSTAAAVTESVAKMKEAVSTASYKQYDTSEIMKQIESMSSAAKTESEKMKEFGNVLSQLEVPEIRTDNLQKLSGALEGVETKLDTLRTKLMNSLTTGRITESVDDRGYRNLQEQIAFTEKTAGALREKISQIEAAASNTSGLEKFRLTMSRISGSSAKFKNTISGISSVLRKFQSGINSAVSKILKLAKSMLGLNRTGKQVNTSLGISFKTLLKYGFGIRSLYVLFNKLRGGIVDGFGNLVQYSDRTNASVSMLKNSITQLKNSFAAMTAPILNAFAPAINTVIQLCISAANAINQLFSALTGGGTWIRAKKLTDSYAASAAGAAKETKKAMAGLREFDELKVINLPDNSGGGGGGGAAAADMFETLPIEQKFKDLAAKIKDIALQIFEPLKKAWNRDGKSVMVAWRTALGEVWELTKAVGRDFLEVWKQEKTVDMFSDILKIVKDIGFVIAGFAKGLRAAWAQNEVGKRIFENIRDIFGAIIKNIREAADYTVKWAYGLDFSPITKAFERFTKSLIPLVDSLSGVLSDFYTMVLLPLGKWTLENGLPKLLDVFTAFNNKVDWAKLRKNLADLWAHLEPFAEKVGEGLIIFIERVSDRVANFINSEAFENFLHAVEKWMDNVKPEQVANGIEFLIGTLVTLKALIAGFESMKGIVTIYETLKKIKEMFGGKALGKTLEGGGFASLIGKFKDLGTKIFGSISEAFASAGGISGILSVDLISVAGIGGTIAMGVLGGFFAIWAGWDFGAWLYEKFTGVKAPEFSEIVNVDNWLEGMKVWGNDIKNSWFDLTETLKKGFSETVEDWRYKWLEAKENWNNSLETLKTKTNESLNSISDFFKNGWQKVTDWWNNNGISKWWNESVAPWFTVEKWTNAMGGIVTAFKTTFDKAFDVVKQIWNKFANWLNSKLNFEIPPITIAGNTIFGGGKINLGKIPTFSGGGFPSAASLFYANENGVPELVGTIGGKTAVTSGNEITGIADAVYSTGQTEASLLQTAVGLLEIIAQKEYGISSDVLFNSVRKSATNYSRRTGRAAFDY